MHTIKPIDRRLVLEAARETGAIVTSEEHNVLGGLGGAVAEVVGEEYPPIGDENLASASTLPVSLSID